MRRPGLEPGSSEWKSDIITPRPSTLDVYLSVYDICIPEICYRSGGAHVWERAHPVCVSRKMGPVKVIERRACLDSSVFLFLNGFGEKSW